MRILLFIILLIITPYVVYSQANISKKDLKVGKNIASGQISPIAVMESWMNSPGHRAAILNPNYTEIGVGVNYEDGYYGISWVQLFGRPGR